MNARPKRREILPLETAWCRRVPRGGLTEDMDRILKGTLRHILRKEGGERIIYTTEQIAPGVRRRLAK